jgi:hypothetical protein
MALPRNDSAIAFAGSTDDAYPLMIQMINSVRMFPPSLDRSMDIEDVRGHTVRIFNGMRDQIKNLPVGLTEPWPTDAVLILGGLSVRRNQFKIWTLHFDHAINAFTYKPAARWRGDGGSKYVTFAGNRTDEAKERLVNLLRDKNKLGSGGLDMEPFEVLRDMIRERADDHIGGPPQVMKVYRHMNVVPFGVKWMVGNSTQFCLHGRPLLDYEAPRYPILDPDSLEIHHVYSKGKTWLENPRGGDRMSESKVNNV